MNCVSCVVCVWGGGGAREKGGGIVVVWAGVRGHWSCAELPRGPCGVGGERGGGGWGSDEVG